jgi:sulfoxide reductase catalytic subunit YedY
VILQLVSKERFASIESQTSLKGQLIVESKPDGISSREITPESIYLNRRNFMRAGILAASAFSTGLVYRKLNHVGSGGVVGEQIANLAKADDNSAASGFFTAEAQTPIESITHYNNFYEFSTDKEAVAEASSGFISTPWTIAVGGLVRKPRVFDLDTLYRLRRPEERIYRMRCVEGWSMVIPWTGVPLSSVLNAAEPLSGAKFVAFETLLDPSRMPNQRREVLAWPYVEGLRIEEAMHPLSLVARGL